MNGNEKDGNSKEKKPRLLLYSEIGMAASAFITACDDDWNATRCFLFTLHTVYALILFFLFGTEISKESTYL